MFKYYNLNMYLFIFLASLVVSFAELPQEHQYYPIPKIISVAKETIFYQDFAEGYFSFQSLSDLDNVVLSLEPSLKDVFLIKLFDISAKEIVLNNKQYNLGKVKANQLYKYRLTFKPLAKFSIFSLTLGFEYLYPKEFMLDYIVNQKHTTTYNNPLAREKLVKQILNLELNKDISNFIFTKAQFGQN